MSLPSRVSCHHNPLSPPPPPPPPVHHHHQGFTHISPLNNSSISSRFQWHWHWHWHTLTNNNNNNKKNPSVLLRHCHRRRRRCSIIANADASGGSDADNYPVDLEGSMEEDKSHERKSLSFNEILKRLRRYGVSGILAYGLLNTAYYLTTFLLVWFYVAPASGKMGYFAAVQRFLKLMAMVWAGSQVTKLLRAGGALALSPFVDKGLSWFTVKFKFESQGKAFMAIVGSCFGLALILFLTVTLLWA